MSAGMEEGEIAVLPVRLDEDEDRKLTAFSLSLDEAAVIYATASTVVERLVAGEYIDKPYSHPIPRGWLNTGEAVLLFPAVMGLILTKYPCLADMDVLRGALGDAALRHRKGKVN